MCHMTTQFAIMSITYTNNYVLVCYSEREREGEGEGEREGEGEGEKPSLAHPELTLCLEQISLTPLR